MSERLRLLQSANDLRSWRLRFCRSERRARPCICDGRCTYPDTDCIFRRELHRHRPARRWYGFSRLQTNISTRENANRSAFRRVPDYIDEEILNLLKRYRVRTVELGIQSMDDGVLAASRRGHTAADTRRACGLIRRYGFELVGQMMIGLPDSDETSETETARAICDMGAMGARIYPTVVFRGTALADMAARGEYTPLVAGDGCGAHGGGSFCFYRAWDSRHSGRTAIGGDGRRCCERRLSSGNRRACLRQVFPRCDGARACRKGSRGTPCHGYDGAGRSFQGDRSAWHEQNLLNGKIFAWRHEIHGVGGNFAPFLSDADIGRLTFIRALLYFWRMHFWRLAQERHGYRNAFENA